MTFYLLKSQHYILISNIHINFSNALSLFSRPVSVPLWLLCGSLLECSGLCEQSLHGDALCSGKYNEFNTTKKKILHGQ